MLELPSNADKNTLRKELIKCRKAITNKVELDKKIVDIFLQCDEYINAKQILCYVSLSDEISTDYLINTALSDNKKVAVPLCLDSNGTMDFFYINSLDDLHIGSFGVREPKQNDNNKVTDFEKALIVVPALSYDENGYRIGYGKGYYDRYLQIHSLNSVGLCYNSFVLKKVPTNQYDKPVDFVVTEFGKII